MTVHSATVRNLEPPVMVRKLEPRDIDSAVRIVNACIANGESSYGPEPFTREQLQAELFDAPAKYESYVCEKADGAIAGWVGLLRHTHRDIYDTIAELAVFVAGEHRRAGIGRALVQHALDCAVALEFRALLAIVQPWPAHVIAWAFRLGFRRIGGLDGALPAVVGCRDILLLQRTLPARGNAL
jgi:L-amino acid N-acyltransferase YncA